MPSLPSWSVGCSSIVSESKDETFYVILQTTCYHAFIVSRKMCKKNWGERGLHYRVKGKDVGEILKKYIIERRMGGFGSL